MKERETRYHDFIISDGTIYNDNGYYTVLFIIKLYISEIFKLKIILHIYIYIYIYKYKGVSAAYKEFYDYKKRPKSKVSVTLVRERVDYMLAYNDAWRPSFHYVLYFMLRCRKQETMSQYKQSSCMRMRSCPCCSVKKKVLISLNAFLSPGLCVSNFFLLAILHFTFVYNEVLLWDNGAE